MKSFIFHHIDSHHTQIENHNLICNFSVCVYSHVCVHAYTYVGKQTRTELGALPYDSPPCPLKQDASLNLELGEWPAKCSLSPAVLGL